MKRRSRTSRLARLVSELAGEIENGEIGSSGMAAAILIEEDPARLLELLELLEKGWGDSPSDLPGDAVLAAVTFLIGRGLERIRFGVDENDAAMSALAETVRHRLAALTASGALASDALIMVLREFSIAKLDPGPELRAAMRGVLGESGEEVAAGGDLLAVEPTLDTAIDLAGDEPFAVHAAIAELIEHLPIEPRQAVATGLLRSDNPTGRAAALGWLFDPEPEVALTVARALGKQVSAEQTPGDGALPETTLRRLIAVRNWLAAPVLQAVDRVIEDARRADVACAAWPDVKIRETIATAIDGAGAQSVFVCGGKGRRHSFASVLIKHGTGVVDAMVRHDIPRAEIDAMLFEVRNTLDTFPVPLATIRTMLEHALAAGSGPETAGRAIGSFALLDVVETVGLSDLQPRLRGVDDLLAELESDLAGAAPIDDAAVANFLKRSRSLPPRFGFLASWFESEAAVRPFLDPDATERGSAVGRVLDRLLPERAERWIERLAWTAFTLRHARPRQPWEDFVVSAMAIRRGTALRDIPLMMLVAQQTVDALPVPSRKGRRRATLRYAGRLSSTNTAGSRSRK